MKKIILGLLLVNLALAAFSQTSDLKKSPSLGINFFLKDFKTPDAIGQTTLSTVLNNGTWCKVGDMKPGLGLQYINGLTNHIDYTANLNAAFLDFPFYNGTTLGQDKFLLEATGGFNFKLLTDNYLFVPYLHAGLGLSMLGGNYFGAFIPIGAGAQIKLGEGNFINLQWLYNLRLTDNTTYNFQYSIGFVGPMGTRKPKLTVAPPPPPPVVVAEKDTDGDGIVDSKDKCPTVKGIAKYDGCPIPDTDGDGINDEQDKCPTVKGIAKYNGCPIPDTDGDGINDEEDKCPTVPGVARYHGCPIPDTDGDGINDEEDKCPTEKGTVANHGCPELKEFNFNYKNIQFITGSAKLTPVATKELDKLVEILNEHNTLNILIEGYTDNIGKPAYNVTLSQKRADAAKDYLVNKGIDAAKLTATGYGQEKPIADNKTVTGRTQNRRVEFNVKK